MRYHVVCLFWLCWLVDVRVPGVSCESRCQSVGGGAGLLCSEYSHTEGGTLTHHPDQLVGLYKNLYATAQGIAKMLFVFMIMYQE